MSGDRPTAPAEGERSASVGYFNQYKFCASLILRSLHEGQLQWIRVADPEANRVDDFQIVSQYRVDAFQVKWSTFRGSFTFNNLTSKKNNAPSIIAQLADGWKRLQEVHPDNRIVVHLITNDIPSSSDKPPANDRPPKPRHFAAFIEQVWKAAKKDVSLDDELNIPEAWKSAWDELQKASGLSVKEFKYFLRDCELEFDCRHSGYDAVTSRDKEIFQQDLEHLEHELFATVAHPAKDIEFDRKKLLTRLGWMDRFEFRNLHEFPVNEILYQEDKDLVNQFQDALDNLSGGYIAVLGTPGSGKSTFLTKTLRRRPERVIRYYSYVPDARDPQILRGESVNFLHDVVHALERAGFRVGEGIIKFDRDQLLKRFHDQLSLLHQDWKNNGRKTVILVDGLDHIKREQKPNLALMDDLPFPEEVPEGVYFVLGSQTDEPFPDRIQSVVRHQDRRIEMRSLNRDAVFNVIELFAIPVTLTSDQKERIFRLSEGHPLALMYLMNHLKGAKSPEDIENVLSATEPYRENIEEQYHSYWRQIESEYELVHLLGLLARLRGVIDLSWVETWYDDPSVVYRLSRTMSHYFRREDQNRWYFFHNSFRIFLHQRTAESPPGEFNRSNSLRFHEKLAKICAQESTEFSWASWDVLYHWASAEKHEEVLKCATQEWFRNQFLAFRPVDIIRSDIRFAIRSAMCCKDPVAFTRLVLAATEIDDRGYYLENASIVPLLLDIGEKQIAVEYLRDGNRLRVKARDALRMSIDLKSAGLIEEGRRVFELAEPLDLLSSPNPVEEGLEGDKIKLLEAWSSAAVHFRNLDEIISTICQIRLEPRQFRQISADTATKNLQNKMLFNVGIALLTEEKWDGFNTLGSSFDIAEEGDRRVWFWLQVHAWIDRVSKRDLSKARSILDEITSKISFSDHGTEERVVLAEGIYRIYGDEKRARECIQGVTQPEIIRDPLSTNSDLSPFLYRFRLNRLLYTFEDHRTPDEIIPDYEEPRDQGIVQFERSICLIAHIWAESWRGNQLDAPTITKHILPLIRLHNKRFRDTVTWTSWSIISDIRSEFYDLLINAVALHGQNAIEALRISFENEWNNSTNKPFWPTNIRREIILALNNAGIQPSWAVENLQALEDTMLESQDISGRVEECRKQAEAWISLGEKERARQILERMLQMSFGVGYRKDYQLDSWISWLSKINKVEPNKAAERIAWFAQAITTLEYSTEGEASNYAANELLAITFRWSPRNAVSLFRWFIDQRKIVHEDAIYALLHEALKLEDPPIELIIHTMFDFLLPVSNDADQKLASDLIDRIADCYDEIELIEKARYILSKLDIYALPSTRPRWKYGIVQAFNKLKLDPYSIGLASENIKPDQEGSSKEYSSDLLKLKGDPSSLSIEEVETMINSVSDLQDLIENESDGSHFDWRTIVVNLVENLDTKDDIYKLADIYRIRSHSAEILATLSEKLSALGDFQGAWSLGEQALEASNASGWYRWFGDGSRLDAFRALVLCNSKRARPIVWKKLNRDLSNEFWSKWIALNLEEIIPLLVDEIPINAIWEEVEKYSYALFESSSLQLDISICFDDQITQDTPSHAIADLLMIHIDHPVNIVAQSAQLACAKLLLQGNSEVQYFVREYLGKNEGYQEAILMVLDAVSLRDPIAIEPFREEISSISQSPNYVIRIIIRNIGDRIGLAKSQAVGQISDSGILLPLTYQLVLPYSIPNDLAELEIYAAIETEIPPANIRHREIEIMQQLESQKSWLEISNEGLLSILTSARLRFPYRTPEAVMPRKATYHMIAELFDAGAFDPNRLDIELRSYDPAFYDPVMILAEPEQRPTCLTPIKGLGRYGADKDVWLEEVETKVTCTIDEDFLVLAEETTLKRLTWEIPTEVRRSVICLPESVTSKRSINHLTFFLEITNQLAKEYATVSIERDPIPLVLRHDVPYSESHGKNWLALNPAIAHQMGWNSAEGGLFRWVNDEGRTMVKSIWWADGFIDQSPPQFDDEVGEGWVVVASQEAFNAIKSKFGTLKRIVNVKRCISQDGQLLQREANSEQVIE